MRLKKSEATPQPPALGPTCCQPFEHAAAAQVSTHRKVTHGALEKERERRNSAHPPCGGRTGGTGTKRDCSPSFGAFCCRILQPPSGPPCPPRRRILQPAAKPPPSPPPVRRRSRKLVLPIATHGPLPSNLEIYSSRGRLSFPNVAPSRATRGRRPTARHWWPLPSPLAAAPPKLPLCRAFSLPSPPLLHPANPNFAGRLAPPSVVGGSPTFSMPHLLVLGVDPHSRQQRPLHLLP